MKKLKQIVSILLIVVLILLYVVAIVVAFLDVPYKEPIIQSCIFSSVMIPIFLWISISVLGFLKKKNDTFETIEPSSGQEKHKKKK